jgi:hypothetical protein
MRSARRGSDRPKGALEKFQQFLPPMPQDQAGELKLAGHVEHILAGGGKEINAAPGEVSGLGLGEIAAIAHDNAVGHPPCSGLKELALVDRGGREVKAAEASRFVPLDVQLNSIPPAHAVFGFACPVSKGALLPYPREVTDLNGRGVWQDDGRGALGMAIAMEHQR